MDFQPPEPADLANARALNRAFVDLLAAGERHRHTSRWPAETVARIRKLGPVARDRLAEAPFLLFSLGYADERWPAVFDGRRQTDLLQATRTPSAMESGIVTAAVGYLWQLCNARPYVARVVSGADTDWCARLGETPLVDLQRFASINRGLLGLRRAADMRFWKRLLECATSPETRVRRAACMSAMQMLLTTAQPSRDEALRAAACTMPAPARGIAVSPPRARGYNTPPDEGARNRKPDEDLPER